MYHYESENWKALAQEIRPHTTGYRLREHTGIDPTSKRGYHLEIWTNKYTHTPIMLTAWQQPDGDWFCQAWDGGTIDFEAMKEKSLRQKAKRIEKEIEAMDKDVDYLKDHGSQEDYDAKCRERQLAHQKLTDIDRQLEG